MSDKEEERIILKLDCEHTLEIERIPRSRKNQLCYDHWRYVSVDSEKRILTCKKCGQVVDAFDYVERWAIEGERRMQGLKGIEAKRKIAAAEFKMLDERITTIRSRLKRAGQPQPESERQQYKSQLWNA